MKTTTEFWKQPKQVRTTVEMKREQLKKSILDNEATIQRLKGWLAGAEENLEKNRKELTLLEETFKVYPQ
jgi:hypothetical protein